MKEVTKKIPKSMAKQFRVCAFVDLALRHQMATNEAQKKEYWDELEASGLKPKNSHGATVDHDKYTLTYRVEES